MGWLLAGCFGLALVNISVATEISQLPRFYWLQPGATATIYCESSKQNATVAKWYKADKYDDERKEEIKTGERNIVMVNFVEFASLYIHNLTKQDNGVYFCQIGDRWGSGTELRVSRLSNRVNAQYRSQMKDGLIIFQGLLLAVCVGAVLLRKRHLLGAETDSIYEEPETDHIYEGLAIETCGGGLYEELSVYAQADGTEAPWE